MRLGENDKVMVLARTDHDDEAQTEQIDTSDADAEPTAEQLAAMVVQPISQMGLAEDESLAELQQALLHMMESMQPKQSDENDDQ